METITINFPNGDTETHDLTGLVFGRGQRWEEKNGSAIEHATYCNMLKSEVFKNIIRLAVKYGEWDHRTNYLLVRHGKEGEWNYYPLPLIYGSEEERRKTAIKAGKKTPTRAWVNRKRKLIAQELDIAFVPAERLNNIPMRSAA